MKKKKKVSEDELLQEIVDILQSYNEGYSQGERNAKYEYEE